MIFISMERGDSNLNYGVRKLYFGSVNFKFTGGGNTPQEDALKKKKKSLRKTRIKHASIFSGSSEMRITIQYLDHCIYFAHNYSAVNAFLFTLANFKLRFPFG